MPTIRKRAKHASSASDSPNISGVSTAHASKKPLLIIIAIVLVILAIGIGLFLSQGGSGASSTGSGINIEAPEYDLTEGEQNPIDFPTWMSRNNDVYAWLYVPGTQVNLPILQSSIADNYYLYHNIDQEDDVVGATYTQALNSKNFTDSITVVYGHTFELNDEHADEAFGTLHNFEDPAFFAEHPYFYIYTTSGLYTYKIVSAYNYDNRHILNSLDFSNPEEIHAYFDSVIDPEDENAVVIEDVDSLDSTNARLVQLSTCTRPADSDSRYIVTGVLESTTPLVPSW